MPAEDMLTTFQSSPNIPLITFLQRFLSSIASTRPMSKFFTELLGLIGVYIDPDTSHANNTLVCSSNPAIFRLVTRTAFSKASSRICVLPFPTLTNSRYAERNRKGNCLDRMISYSSQSRLATSVSASLDTPFSRKLRRLRSKAI